MNESSGPGFAESDGSGAPPRRKAAVNAMGLNVFPLRKAPGRHSPGPAAVTDSTESRPPGDDRVRAVVEARRMFRRTMAAWVSDLLVLRRSAGGMPHFAPHDPDAIRGRDCGEPRKKRVWTGGPTER